jgi:hypothetical protein
MEIKIKSPGAGQAPGIAALLEDLSRGVPVRVLAAPAAFGAFEDFPRLAGWLHAAGVRGLHPVLPYADITLWAYFRLLRENPGRPLISSACVGINRRLQKNLRDWGPFLSGVFSPLLCTARYLKKYRGFGERFAFLSPCVLKEAEFTRENGERLIHYNLTLGELGRWLEDRGVDLKEYDPRPLETESNGRGLTLAASGGIGKALAPLVPGLEYHVEQGTDRALAWLLEHRDRFLPGERRGRPFLLELYACPGGCSNGSGVGERQKARTRSGAAFGFLKQAAPADPEKIRALFSHYDRTLEIRDFLV